MSPSLLELPSKSMSSWSFSSGLVVEVDSVFLPESPDTARKLGSKPPHAANCITRVRILHHLDEMNRPNGP